MAVIDEIAAERNRQVVVEWHDAAADDRQPGEMAMAAAAYAQVATSTAPYKDGLWEPAPNGTVYRVAAPECWPWDMDAWKPKNPRRDLIRAAALIAAEIERLDRASARQAAE